MSHLNRTLMVFAAVAAMLFGAALATPSSAHADRVTKRIESKTKKAMEEYDVLEFEAAKSLLMEAIAFGEKNDSKSTELATAYLNLGIVYFAGLGDEEAAQEAMDSAVALDPKIELSLAYSTPELAAILDRARANAPTEPEDAGGCDIEGIAHELVDEAAIGSAPQIVARLGNSRARSMHLYYRPEGQLEFSKVEMSKRGDCEYRGEIPSDATSGAFVHYYVASIAKNGKELDHRGTSGSPNIIEVSASVGSRDNDNPLVKKGGDGSLTDGKAPKVFLSIGAGTGSGLVSGQTEKSGDEVSTGFASAPFHLMPEIGYFIDERLAVSAAFRMGFPLGANIDGHATFAPAGLLRVRYGLGTLAQGVQLNAAIGAGIIRNTVRITDMAVPGMDVDTTAMGPVLLGAGAGYVLGLGGPMRLVLEANALAALAIGVTEIGCPGDGCVEPISGLQIDANLALLFAF